MVKTVVGEETQLKSAEDRLSRSSIKAEVGIIVGKINPHLERGFVYALIPTPPTDGGSPACRIKSEAGGREDRKKGSKGGGKPSAEAVSSLLIDGEWVAEHARQVSRMLLGGMSVIGIYIWSSEVSFKATSASLLTQAIRVLAQATPSFESDANERLLIHISYSPRRWACRNCAFASVDLRPCDFKMSKLLAHLQTYRCMYGFDIRIPVFHHLVSTSNTFKHVLFDGISRHAKELQSARALLDGKLVTENQQATSVGVHNVELLLPFKSDADHHGIEDDIAGLVVFRGAICAYAYISPKEPTSQAISDLKNDIINSLKSRLDIVLDEGEDTLSMVSNDLGKASGEIVTGKQIHQLILQEVRKPLVLSFPRRILVPWLSDVFICDYLLPSETFEDLKDRCRELLSMETPVESSELLELETEAAPPTMASSFWDLVHGKPLSSNEKPKNSSHPTNNKSKNLNFNLQVALFILLVAFLIGGAITVFNPAKLLH